MLKNLDNLDEWPGKVKTMQKNWIGKSFGSEIKFKIEGSETVENIECYTTRPDTLFGMSFLALSVDHPVAKFYKDDDNFKLLYEYIRNIELGERPNQLKFPDEFNTLENQKYFGLFSQILCA